MVVKIPTIEFIRDKIYLGAFDYDLEDTHKTAYLSLNDTPSYNGFNHDFGPLTVAHLYRFAVILHEVLGKPENKNKELVFYSDTDPRSRANAATLLASYMVLIQNWQPHQVLAPLVQAVPMMPFRDAGYSVADFMITIQDVVYALWRAKNHGLLEMRSFNLDEHEKHEQVEYGDLNSIGDHFVAFASPVTANPSVEYVLRYFEKHNVKLVVRLNSKLYEKEIFESKGIKHIDLIFDDGTCPTMAYVQGFIGAAEGVIKEGGKIAVHCRAGLGRTGCLIGAHLIYTYGFTAQEVIAYMRFLRPGMVVGPQQHWLYQHQNEFRDWRHTMRVGYTPDPSLAGYTPLVDAILSSRSSRASSLSLKIPTIVSSSNNDQNDGGSPVKSLDDEGDKVYRNDKNNLNQKLNNERAPHTPQRNIIISKNSSSVNACLPEPTPGQPRKTQSPLQARSVPARAQLYTSGTNSDDEESLYDCSQGFSSPEEEADRIITTKRTQAVSLISKNRSASTSSLRLQGRSSGALSFSNSRNLAKPKVRSVSRQRRELNTDRENSGTLTETIQRRDMSFMSSVDQIAIAKQMRVCSNPAPRRKRSPEEGLEPIDQERVTPVHN